MGSLAAILLSGLCPGAANDRSWVVCRHSKVIDPKPNDCQSAVMRCIVQVCLVIALASSVSARDDNLSPVNYPDLPTFVSDPEGFVPAGWKLIAVKSGDLNGDGRTDVAVLMRMTDPANVEPVTSSPYYENDDTNPYLLAIGFGEIDGYALAATHHALFPREVAPMHGDDPPSEDTIDIDDSVLQFTFGHLRGFEHLRFRWNGDAFALIGYDCAGVAGGKFIFLSANYLTGKARYERGQVDSDDGLVSAVEIRPDHRSTLEQIEWGLGWAGTDTSGAPLGC